MTFDNVHLEKVDSLKMVGIVVLEVVKVETYITHLMVLKNVLSKHEHFYQGADGILTNKDYVKDSGQNDNIPPISLRYS